MADEARLTRLHYELIRGVIERGACPPNSEIAERMGLTEPDVQSLLRHLAAIHGVVLHPHADEPWILHPFSLTPTLHWVSGETGSWWAPCIWCALGVAALIGGAVRIHSRFGAEDEPLVIDVTDGLPRIDREVWVHFAIPPARAWDNVHQHCSLVLPFSSPASVDQWCQRHSVRRGEAVPLMQVSRLARAWYGTHANPGWRKWTVAEAQEIFRSAGLTSGFWRLEQRDGTF